MMTLRRLNQIKKFNKTPIKIIRKKGNSVFGVSDIYGIKLLTRLRVTYSHSNKHKFRHNLNDAINPMFNCSAATETTVHYLLH